MGENPLSSPPLELSPVNVLCRVPFHLFCRLAKYTVVGTALGPALAVGMSAFSPDDSQVLLSPGHWHRSTEVRPLDCSNHAPGPTVGAMEAAQGLT